MYWYFSLFFCSCRYNNESVFEEATDISIPSSTTITKDEYHDMGQDYVKILQLKLNEKSAKAIELSILKSSYFNSAIKSDSGIDASQQIKFQNVSGIWYRYQNGFKFHGNSNKNRDVILAEIDTVKMIGSFELSSD